MNKKWRNDIWTSPLNQQQQQQQPKYMFSIINC